MQPPYQGIYHSYLRFNLFDWLSLIVVRMRKWVSCFSIFLLVSSTLVIGLILSEINNLNQVKIDHAIAAMSHQGERIILFTMIYVGLGILFYYLARFTQNAQTQRSIKQGSIVEDEMRQMAQEQELNELKSRFVSMVSHELRTPLTVIKTSTEILEHYSHATTEEKRHLYFQRIHSAIHNMTQLLEDVLTINKAEAGTLTLCPLLLDLNHFCEEVIHEMQANSPQTLSFFAQEDCRNVYFDPNLLRPTLANLLSNAIKYSPKGDPIEVQLSRQGQIAILTVRDHGIGIPPEDQPYLFKLFHRGKNVDTIQGTGLGLAIAKHCITLHQGKISFTSEVGRGTTFILQIPLNLKASPMR